MALMLKWNRTGGCRWSAPNANENWIWSEVDGRYIGAAWNVAYGICYRISATRSLRNPSSCFHRAAWTDS